MKLEISSTEIKTALKQARERIESAEALLKINNYRDAMSRAYYAFFDAASAALLTRGLVTKTHHGLIILFEKHFIKTKQVPVEVGRWLAKAKQAREEADYEREKEISKESVKVAIQSAKKFVEQIEKLTQEEINK